MTPWSRPIPSARAAAVALLGLGMIVGSAAAASAGELEARRQEAHALYVEGRHAEALAIYRELARKDPNVESVLGTLGAILMLPEQTRADVDRRTAAADAAPDDPLLQYEAGLTTHYYAHSASDDAAEQRALYEQTIEYLQRTLPAYDRSPRVWIYLSVSYFRLGRVAEADAAIAKAIERGERTDPDVFYCRAEITRFRDPAGATRDLNRYLRQMQERMRQTAKVKMAKEIRAQRLRDWVAARATEPLREPTPLEVLRPWSEIPWWRVHIGADVVFLGVTLLITAAWLPWAWRRLRRT